MKQSPQKFFICCGPRKEALLKATSKGVDDDLPNVPSLDGLHDIKKEIIGSDESWAVSSFKIEDNYIGSIAYKSAQQKVVFFDIRQGLFFSRL